MPDQTHESLLKTDFSKGEQFWRFWITKRIRLESGETARFKIFSKRTATDRFEVICATDLEDGSKVVWAEGYWTSDQELVAFVRGVHATLVHLVGHELVLESIDLRQCTTYEAWNYKMQEATTARIWDAGDGATVKGEF